MPVSLGSACKNIHSFKLTLLLVFLRIPLQGITEIKSEVLESLFSSMIALSGENSLKMSGDLLGVERKSSSFSSGILGMSGYSRSWRFLSSLTLGIKIFDQNELQFHNELFLSFFLAVLLLLCNSDIIENCNSYYCLSQFKGGGSFYYGI